MIKYNVDYYYNLLKIHTCTAKEINDLRWNFVAKYTMIDKIARQYATVLDYGCGPGWFAAFKPDYIRQNDIDTFDIMPVPQTGIRRIQYSVVTLWDVLEHIADFTDIENVINRTNFVAMTIPIKPDSIRWNSWKHFKPGEHLHYYTVDLLKALFRLYGFSLKIDEMIECPPRSDVHSLIFEKSDWVTTTTRNNG